jgi:transposase-like protein
VQSARRPTRQYKAERLLRNLARRLDQEAPGVAASILEGLDEMLTVNRLRLPAKLRRSLACTNSIENMMGTVRRVCRNVKRWRNAAMALRWTAAGMMEAAKGFRRLKAYKQLPILRLSLTLPSTSSPRTLNRTLTSHNVINGNACFAYFNKIRGIPAGYQAAA